MVIREYLCKKCGKVQEKWLERIDSINKESCEQCGAPPSKLELKLASVKKHGSWSRWNIG